ncbi:MAG: 50S ribosomal protein L17, partial [Clostridiales bacterium]|nr:50S ribosomal protein L17 [Clostridiales bacterium]
GRTASQRKAMLRNLTTNLLWYGRIETTEAKAKEVRAIADKMITLAIREYDKTVEVEKEFYNDKKQIVKETFVNDLPSKLHARRLMMAYLYDIKELQKDDENKAEYKERTKDNKHPVVEKLFREYGPKYRARNEEKNCAGGYTRIYKMGPRRGDAAEMVVIELV